MPTNCSQYQELTTLDPQQTARCFDQWQHEYTQISRGAYRGLIQKLGTPGVSILREQVNVSLEQRGTCPSGSIVFSTFVQTGCHAKYPQNEYHFGDAQIHDDRFERNLISDENADAITVTLDSGMMDDRSKSLARRCGATITLHGNDAVARARDCAVDALDVAKRNAEIRDSLHWACAVSRTIIDAIEFALEQNTIPFVPVLPRASERLALVERARSTLLDNDDEPVLIGTVCRQLRVSRRTLQSSFSAEFGMCPAEYVRTYRLNRCRDELRRSSPGTTVIEVASRWGFWHPGRFARCYRQLFHESPSNTLRRSL